MPDSRQTTLTTKMQLFVQGLLWAVAHAATHELIVGTFQTNALYTLRFDDSAHSLQLVEKVATPFASSWIALSVGRFYCLENIEVSGSDERTIA